MRAKTTANKLVWVGLVIIILLSAVIRIGELHTYGPTPGDDISYLNNVRDAYAKLRETFPRPTPLLRFFSPFIVANRLTQTTYRKMAFTSLAKPLYILKLAIIEGTFGLDLYRQQLCLAVAGILSVLVVFSIGWRLFGPLSGLIAAFLMAISPWAVRYSTYGIPTADSLFLLLLAVWLLVSHRPRPFLTGLVLGAAIMFNPNIIWPALVIAALKALRWWLNAVGEGVVGRKLLVSVLNGFFKLGLGIIIIPILWELGSLIHCTQAGLPYLSLWAPLQEAMEDNVAHSILLPIDPLFWFRLVAVTEGWPQLIIWSAALVWLLWIIAGSERRSRFPPLAILVAMLGTIIAANWSGTTQCSRHYVLAWPLGLIAIGGMVSSCFFLRIKTRLPRFPAHNLCAGSLAMTDLKGVGQRIKGAVDRFGPKLSWVSVKGVRITLIVVLLFSCVVSSATRLLQYRYSRQGGYRLARWIEDNFPAERVIAPANQPDEMWPGVPRFHNWPELEEREEKEGPLYIAYGDYLAITRGIWDYPKDMFSIAQACRAFEGETFRTGTHLSAPSFLYENEDYYWGFVRQKKEAFDPDLRVIPAAAVLAYRANPPQPVDAAIIDWQHADGRRGRNVYWSFLRFSIFPYRSPWVAIGMIGVLIALTLWSCWPSSLEIKRWFYHHYPIILLGAVLLIGLIFRSHGLGQFTQMGGDDVEYRVYVQRGSSYPRFKNLHVLGPFVLATQLSQLDVNKTITSLAKPLFLLERCLLEFVVGSSIRTIHFWTCLQGVAIILVVFLIGRMMGGLWGGIVSSVLWALSPWAVTYSTWGIHVAGGIFWFSLAVLFYLRYRAAPSLKKAFLAGLILGVSFLYSSSNLWPVLCLLLIDFVWRLCQIGHNPGGWREVGKGWLSLTPGLVIPWLGWEFISLLCAAVIKGEYLSFPRVLWNTMRDNVLHASRLPVDLSFFWRHLFVSEGPIVGAGMIVAVLWILWLMLRRRAPEQVAILLALLFGITVTMNYTGGSQVIRHFFPAWLPLTLLTGWAASRLLQRRPLSRWIIGAIFIVLIFAQWNRLNTFRLARWAPGRVRAWAWVNYIPNSVATLACQNMSLWPRLRPITSWDELEGGAGFNPPGVMMYSDYIEIGHGSWFYSFPAYYEISEVARRTQGDLFRTPSYLSYRPSLFENEFYFWGLYREPFDDFDPAIRILPAGALVEKWEKISSDDQRLEEFWAPTKKEPLLRLPSRPDDILRPFMSARPRPSYRIHLIIAILGLLGLAGWGQGFKKEGEQ